MTCWKWAAYHAPGCSAHWYKSMKCSHTKYVTHVIYVTNVKYVPHVKYVKYVAYMTYVTYGSLSLPSFHRQCSHDTNEWSVTIHRLKSSHRPVLNKFLVKCDSCEHGRAQFYWMAVNPTYWVNDRSGIILCMYIGFILMSITVRYAVQYFNTAIRESKMLNSIIFWGKNAGWNYSHEETHKTCDLWSGDRCILVSALWYHQILPSFWWENRIQTFSLLF